MHLNWWKEAEKLVDEGLVRSLSVNMATMQIESILELHATGRYGDL